jgi:hypothetical protein
VSAIRVEESGTKEKDGHESNGDHHNTSVRKSEAGVGQEEGG